MRVIVTAASKHGATSEIAAAIAHALRAAGIETDVTEPEDVTGFEGYDGAVLGSAVYAGRWLPAARDLVERHADELRQRQVWLFSSGPLGDPLRPEGDPVDVEPMVAATDANEHRLLAGRLERSRLGFAERAIVVALRAPDGDFRDWAAIRSWAGEIASAVTAKGVVGAGE